MRGRWVGRTRRFSLCGEAVAANRCAALRAKDLITGDDVAAQAPRHSTSCTRSAESPRATCCTLPTTARDDGDRGDLRERLRPVQRDGQPVWFQLRCTDPTTVAPVPLAAAAAAQIFANSNGVSDDPASTSSTTTRSVVRSSTGHPCRPRPVPSTSPSTARSACAACGPAPPRHRREAHGRWGWPRPAAAKRRAPRAARSGPARQVGDPRRRPGGHPRAAESCVARLLRRHPDGDKRSNARYDEVTNAQHFDAFLPLLGLRHPVRAAARLPHPSA